MLMEYICDSQYLYHFAKITELTYKMLDVMWYVLP